MDTISNIWDKGYKQLFGVSENYNDEMMNMPVVLLNNITSSVSDVFSSISSMTFGEPAKKSGKMMALSLAGEKGKDGKDVIIPKFLSSDDNGNLSMFDLDKHTTDFGFSAKNLSTPGKVTGGQLCIGSTCIDENQLKQLVRPEVSTEKKPTDYYNLSTNSSLIYEEQQNVAIIGWSTVKTIVPHTKNHRIVQQAYKIGPNDTDVSKMYTRYSLSGKDESTGAKNDWTPWKSELYVGDVKEIGKIIPDLKLNNWTVKSGDDNLRFFDNKGVNMFVMHNDVTKKTGWGVWADGETLAKTYATKGEAVLKSEVGVSQDNGSYVNGILTQKNVGTMKIRGW